MPLTMREIGILEPDIFDMARRCSRDRTITLRSYIEIGYDEMLDLYRLML